MKLRYDYHLSYKAEERLCVEWPSHRLLREQLSWLGHALRSPDKVLEEVLRFTPEGGQRGRRRARQSLYDTVKADVLAKNIYIDARKQEDFWTALKVRAANRA